MENIRDQLENRWPFSDTCTSQSTDTSKSVIGRHESDRSAGMQVDRSAKSADRDVRARVGRNCGGRSR
jgi:hypothetical protein